MTWWLNRKYDLAGKTFGRLTVQCLASMEGKRRWSCLCSCGKLTEVAAANLKSGKVVSCGCALKGCNRKEPFLWLYNRLMSDPRKYEKSLTLEEFIGFIKIKHCHYCKASIVWTPYAENRKYGGSYNLDRKDNSKGYTKANCVVCCPRCNRAKGNMFTYAQFKKLGKVIQTFARP